MAKSCKRVAFWRRDDRREQTTRWRRQRRKSRHRPASLEALEPRRVLDGNLIGHWLADSLNADHEEAAIVANWVDTTTGIPAVANGAPRLFKNQLLSHSVIRFDPSDGEDQFRVAADVNPMAGAEDFTIALVFATTGDGKGDVGQWHENSGIVDANEPGDTGDWGVALSRSGQVAAGLGRSERTVYSNPTGLNDGLFHVAIIVRRGGSLSLYVDGGEAARERRADSFPRNIADMTFGSLQTNENYFTGDVAEVRVYDGDFSRAEATALFTELHAFYANHPPVAEDDSFEVNEDGTLFVGPNVGVLANDRDTEGDGLTAVLVQNAQHGTLSLLDSGALVYIPQPNFFGTDTFTYLARDQQSSNTATATINVVSGDVDPSQAVADSYLVEPGVEFSVDAAAGVLTNDMNPEQATLTAVLTDDVAQGSLTLHETGSFTFHPGNFVGTTVFQYRVRDSLGDQNTTAVTLTVNAAPAAIDDSYDLSEDSTLIVDAAQGVLANDSDAEADTLTVTLVDGPANGQLTLTPDGSFTYEPEAEFSGSDSFAYFARDAHQDSSLATVVLNVQTVNDPPSGVTDTFFAPATGPLTISKQFGVLANDIDIDDAELTAVLVDSVSHGTLSLQPDGSLTYRPNQDFRGVDRFTYRVNDGVAESNLVTVSMVVSDLAQPIVINEIHFNTADNTMLAEFIELLNTSSAPVDVSGWRFSDGVDYTLPRGTVIPPLGYLVVAEDPATIAAEFGVTAWGPWSGRLNNDGERVALVNGADELVDEVDFQVGYPWPVASSGNGSSMELNLPSLDNDLGGSWRAEGPPTPGASNTVFSVSAPPQSRQVDHRPETPTSGEDAVVTIKVTDPDGVAGVQLQYQLVLPGQYLPAWLPVPLDELRAVRRGLVPDPTPNPAYHAAENWTTIPMTDDGSGADTEAGDGVFTAVVPAQNHRTLVRYRMTVRDTLGNSATVPYADDPSMNFAYFVYDGVPDYNGHSSDVLETLPVYHFITRGEDMEQVLAYNSRDQMTQGSPAWWAYNWVGAMVYDGVVYDNIFYRLRGANGRYHVQGKRSMKFRFNEGNLFQARDQDGNRYAQPWRFLTANKGFDNRQTLTYGLNEAVSYFLFSQMGIPTADTHWFQFRVIDDAREDPDPWHGDFDGMRLAVETYDVRFLDAHGLEKGNLYKLINSRNRALDQQRYQAPHAVSDGSDHDNLEQNLDGSDSAEYIRNHVNLDLYFRYLALVEAIRHYDYWPSANKNMAYYFEPNYGPENSNLGRLWLLPWDTDASWGPTWNQGHDVVYNSIFPSSAGGGDPDSTPQLWPEYFSVVRGLHDLLWQPDQIEPLIDHFAAKLAPFIEADLDRWMDAPRTAGSYRGLSGAGMRGLDALVEDMKNFAFVGGNWPGGGVGAGGRATHLDRLAEDDEVPEKPTINYVGAEGFPVEDLRFETSPFGDPQGNDTFAAIKWRIARVSDSSAPNYDPEELVLEWNAVWESETATFDPHVTIPADAVEVGNAYRVRVKMMDDTGRWSHWSDPSQFVAPVPTGSAFDSLRIAEINYNPHAATPEIGELDVDKDEFEFVELVNRGSQPVELGAVQFVRVDVRGDDQGIDFTFPVRMLQPGERILVVRNQEAFQSRYGGGLRIAGEYSGRLRNGGEELTLIGEGDQIIQQFRYDDEGLWPRRADGNGSSLEIVDIHQHASSPENWRSSSEFGGSPGSEGLGARTGIVVNEILSNTQAGQPDVIELHNTTGQPVDVTNWYLTDTEDQLLKFQISTPTTIPPLGYASITVPHEAIDFDGLRGGHVFLIAVDDSGRPRQFVTRAQFPLSPPGVTLGRWPDATGPFLLMDEATLGAKNMGPRAGEVMMSEIHYSPLDPDGRGRQRPRDFEFIELYNRTDGVIDLSDWRVVGDTSFQFEPGTTIGAGSSLLLVGFDPADATKTNVFRFLQGAPADAVLIGPFDTELDDQRGAIRLERQGQSPPEDPNFIPYFPMDEVTYESVVPWPSEAAGTGSSLTRTDAHAYGPLPTSWRARNPSPGTVDFFVPIPGDSDDNGSFNQSDIERVLQGGKYMSGQPATWSEGDWTGDGIFNQLDIVAALQRGAYQHTPLAAKAALADQSQSRSSRLANLESTVEATTVHVLDNLFAVIGSQN